MSLPEIESLPEIPDSGPDARNFWATDFILQYVRPKGAKVTTGGVLQCTDLCNAHKSFLYLCFGSRRTTNHTYSTQKSIHEFEISNYTFFTRWCGWLWVAQGEVLCAASACASGVSLFWFFWILKFWAVFFSKVDFFFFDQSQSSPRDPPSQPAQRRNLYLPLSE
mgnify:CR=1 FL=1